MGGRSAASVLCSVQTTTSHHSDTSRLHRAIIVRVPQGTERNKTISIFVTFQPQGFIFAISTRLPTNISSDCKLVQEELLTLASCFVQIPQGIQLCIVCET